MVRSPRLRKPNGGICYPRTGGVTVRRCLRGGHWRSRGKATLHPLLFVYPEENEAAVEQRVGRCSRGSAALGGSSGAVAKQFARAAVRGAARLSGGSHRRSTVLASGPRGSDKALPFWTCRREARSAEIETYFAAFPIFRGLRISWPRRRRRRSR